MSDCRNDEIYQWLAENGLPTDARAIFQGLPGYAESHPIKIAANELFKHKQKLISPLTEVANLLNECGMPEAVSWTTVTPVEVANLIKQGNDLSNIPAVSLEWMGFAECLLSAGAGLPISPWEPPHDKLEEVNEIRRQIFEKSIELVSLARRLTQIDGEKPPEYSSRSWPDLLKSATDIQNNNDLFVKDILSARNGGDGVDRAGVEYQELSITETLELFEPWHDYSMPIIESVILAYGKTYHKDNLYLGEYSSGFDPFRFSRKRGAGDFVRGFTHRLRNDMYFRHLPESIGRLSFSSIEAFAGVFYPFVTPIRAGRYITADWFPRKDESKSKSSN